MNQLGRSSAKTNYQLVLKMNAEQPQVCDIEMENRELRSCLQDHQRALEHIMSKYREHTQKKILNSPITFKYANNDNRVSYLKVLKYSKGLDAFFNNFSVIVQQ